MTTKRVHFAETNLLYSPPPTPSPSLSEASLPSSDGPETPSPLNPYDSLLPAMDCDTPLTGPVRIHHLLGFDQNPPLDFDLNSHPSLITTTAASTSSSLSRQSLMPHVLAQPATIPPLSSLNLIAQNFPWTVSISTATSSDPFVTVVDVLCTLHRTLRLPVSESEFGGLPSQEDMIRVKEAYEDRYKAIAEPRAREEEAKKGVKRVDFLRGRKFLGLSSTNIGPDFWFINVE